jgi:predicted AAA+ superfamily ATPase
MLIYEHSERQIKYVKLDFKRYLLLEIDWSNRLIGLKGARGTGKTTLLLQWLKLQKLSSKEGLYISLDNLYFSTNPLYLLIDDFYKNGGKVLVLDEVHKYKDWSIQIKNAHDSYPDLKIIFTGSSIIDIAKQEGDLSRRVMMYELHGLSYREYLEFTKTISLQKIDFIDILTKSQQYINDISINFRPLSYFDEYLSLGYYPFLIENREAIQSKINQLVRTIVEYDMAEIKGFDIRNAKKMLQLITIIAQQVPFKPNITSLAEKTGIHRNTMLNYLYYLEESKLITMLSTAGNSVAILQKPDKIFLNNTTLLYALAYEKPNIGTVRETFFLSQFQKSKQNIVISLPKKGDFLINDFTFEIGGRNKTNKQIADIPYSFLVLDNLEKAYGKNLPLWLFGMMY